MSAVRKSVSAQPDAVDILTEDHARIRALFRRIDQIILTDDIGAKKELVDEVSKELNIHTVIEEEIFYVAARKSRHVHYLFDEAEYEHASVTEIIAQLRDLGAGEPIYDVKVFLLRDYVHRHFTKEEQKIFPKVRRTNLDLVVLGEKLIQRRQELIR